MSRNTAAQPRVSIVVVTYNSSADLPVLFESIRRHTDDPWEAIVVDNASRDGTRDWIAQAPGVRAILNDTNRGFTAATNQGIAAARGDYVVLLNPDTLVTAGWSSRMRSHLAEGVGAVGPVSNYVAGLQKVSLYLRGAQPAERTLDSLAAEIAASNAGVSQETRLLIGFCMMIPRAVIRRVGMLDEDLFLGNDDLEYSWRLRREGYRLVVATDTFVYHKGQQSFKSDAPSVTTGLVQESTECLYRKLEIAYGAGQVPAPETLWGMSWFRPAAFRHGVLPPEIIARAESLSKAGNRLVPLALLFPPGMKRLFCVGPSEGIVRGLGLAGFSGIDPAGASPEPLRDLGAALPPGGTECALVLGSPAGLDESSASAFLDALEDAAAREILLILPTSGSSAAESRSRIRGSAGDARATGAIPAGWSRDALAARGYDLVEMPDYWGFDLGLRFAIRWKDAQDRESGRRILRGYYHPALLAFSDADVPVATASVAT